MLLCSEDMENKQVCLAFAITIANESFEEWNWFLENCSSHISQLNSERVGVISDRAKGAIGILWTKRDFTHQLN